MITINNNCRIKQVIEPALFDYVYNEIVKVFEIYKTQKKCKILLFSFIYFEIYNVELDSHDDFEIKMKSSKLLFYTIYENKKIYMVGNVYKVRKFKNKDVLKLNFIKLFNQYMNTTINKDLLLKSQLTVSGALTKNAMELIWSEQQNDSRCVLLTYTAFNYAYIMAILLNYTSFLPSNFFMNYHLKFAIKLLKCENIDPYYVSYGAALIFNCPAFDSSKQYIVDKTSKVDEEIMEYNEECSQHVDILSFFDDL